MHYRIIKFIILTNRVTIILDTKQPFCVLGGERRGGDRYLFTAHPISAFVRSVYFLSLSP